MIQYHNEQHPAAMTPYHNLHLAISYRWWEWVLAILGSLVVSGLMLGLGLAAMIYVAAESIYSWLQDKIEQPR